MNIIKLATEDLLCYSLKELQLMADYYNCNVVDLNKYDLAVLLAHKIHSETKVGFLENYQYLITNYNNVKQNLPNYVNFDKLINLMREYETLKENHQTKLRDIPKKDKKDYNLAYQEKLKELEELINNDKHFKELKQLKEDFKNVTDFVWLKNQTSIKHSIKAINMLKQKNPIKQYTDFDNFGEIEEYIEKKYPDVIIDRGNFEPIYKDDTIRVIKINDETSSCYYGRGTKWCTAGEEDNKYDEYAAIGSLYIIIPNKKIRKYETEKYQILIANDGKHQIKDDLDHNVNKILFIKNYPTLENIPIFIKLINSIKLYIAVINSDYKGVVDLIEKGANVNETDWDNKNLLMFASENGDLDIVKLLIENGAIINTISKHNKTPLIYASEKGHLDIVKLLIENGANVNDTDSDNKNLLMFASENGDLDIVKYLIEKGAIINTISINHKTPLMFASENGNLDIVKLLIENGAFVNETDLDDKNALIFASKNGYLDIVKLLIENGAFIDSNALIYASEKGHLDIVKYLIEKGANVNISDIYGKTALNWAIENKHNNIIKLLKENGAIINERAIINVNEPKPLFGFGL
jgi:ankyrin repeat protein